VTSVEAIFNEERERERVYISGFLPVLILKRRFEIID